MEGEDIINGGNDAQGEVNAIEGSGEVVSSGNDGQGKASALEGSHEVVPGGAYAGASGKGEAKADVSASRKELSRSSIEHAFSQAQLPSALNMLVKPGESAKEILMRTRFSKKTEGRIFATSLVYSLGCDIEFDDQADQDDLLALAAAFVSDEGLGRKELVEAITGERHHEELKGGIGSWLRKAAWGDKGGGDDKKD